ncbi:short-chain dehydrogenase [Coleophoma cylindrospora]|uniref:Short-chain dehydrogenase n=1 Tax=Coleophoma cylindrospora TaxID=1849047 RepID=A0A3D8QPM3_9HELO|nr:short-chain dehydrogenase [Coleophoma cylindrospora]
MPKVFLVTGTSTGFGHDLIQEVLNRGDYAVATARTPEALKFNNTTPENYLAVKLDVLDKSTITDAFQRALDKFGRVDVVVNNAGYGLTGCFEESTEEQIRKQMDVNFFGLLDVTRVAIKTMREQKPSGGLIQQITSIGGLRGAGCFSVYCASKFAVEGFTESVAQEMKPEWGIKFTNIEPGGFRTDWAGRSMDFTERHPAYDHFDIKPVMMARNGKQEGDPLKAAKAIYSLGIMENPPLRIVLGSDAYGKILAKLEADKKQVLQYEKLSNSTDVDV